MQKAHMAKNLITSSLMQHTTISISNNPNGRLREKLSARSPSSPGKCMTVDPSNIRAYKEHLVTTKMTPQQKWEQTKQTEADVQNWEKSQKKKEDAKKDEEAKKHEEKKKEMMEQLHNPQVRNYRQLLQEVRTNPARSTLTSTGGDN
jgi:hypothetical protein